MTAVTDRARKALVTLGPVLIVFGVQQVIFPVPAGVFLHGVVVGLLTSMIAVGMALIYRANRVLNFAQGDLGYLPAMLSVMIVVTSGIPWLLAFGIGIASAAALGAACELLIIRRFFKAPRLVLTVATLGLSQLLAFGALVLPTLFDKETRWRVDAPFTFNFDFGGQRFNANHLLVLIIAPLAMALVGVFLQKTAVGVAIRAAADRAERASLLGVPVKGLHTIVWSIAGVLAFLSLFLRSGVIGLPIGTALSLGVLMRALAALMLGRMTNLTTIALSGVAIGVLQMGVDWNGIKFLDQQSPALIEPIVALVAIAALMMRRKDVSRLETDQASSWSAADEVRPVPKELARVPEIRFVRLGALVLGVAGLLFLPHWVEIDTSLKISIVFIYVLVAASIVVVTGWAGQVSLAQVAFMAIGAVAGAKASNEWGWDLSLALLFAGFVGVITAVIIGLPALRVKGLFLAVTTLGFGLATSNWLLNPRFFDFVPNRRIERLPLFGRIDLNSPTRIYYVCLAVCVLVLLGLRGVRHSRTGRVLLALRENERATQAFGISAVRAKLTAFAISGFVAAVAGALYVHHQQSYDAESFSPQLSIVMFTAAVVGGLGSLTGGVLGAIWLEGGFFLLPGNWRFFASSVGVLFVLLVIPGGLGSLVYRVRDIWLRWVADRNQILVPSMIADRKVEDAPPPPPPALDEDAEPVAMVVGSES